MIGASLRLLFISLFAAAGTLLGDLQKRDTALLSAHSRTPDTIPSISLTVANRRNIGLKELDIAPTGSQNFKQVVADLGPGRKIVVAVKKDGKCFFDIHGVFDDGATTNTFASDLCENATINLFE
jgi:hypothetical protein